MSCTLRELPKLPPKGWLVCGAGRSLGQLDSRQQEGRVSLLLRPLTCLGFSFGRGLVGGAGLTWWGRKRSQDPLTSLPEAEGQDCTFFLPGSLHLWLGSSV